VSRLLSERFGHFSTGAYSLDIFASVVELDVVNRVYGTLNEHPRLLDLFIRIRAAQCYDPRDKVYPLLGVWSRGRQGPRQSEVSYAKEGTADSQLSRRYDPSP
jgi:hypothetical protein